MSENRDMGLGVCADESCGKWAVVGLNGRNVCMEHFDEGLRRARQRVDEMVARADAAPGSEGE